MRLTKTLLEATVAVSCVLGAVAVFAHPDAASSPGKEKDSMAPTGSTTASAVKVPAIDAAAPAKFETATFALG